MAPRRSSRVKQPADADSTPYPLRGYIKGEYLYYDDSSSDEDAFDEDEPELNDNDDDCEFNDDDDDYSESTSKDEQETIVAQEESDGTNDTDQNESDVPVTEDTDHDGDVSAWYDDVEMIDDPEHDTQVAQLRTPVSTSNASNSPQDTLQHTTRERLVVTISKVSLSDEVHGDPVQFWRAQTRRTQDQLEGVEQKLREAEEKVPKLEDDLVKANQKSELAVQELSETRAALRRLEFVLKQTGSIISHNLDELKLSKAGKGARESIGGSLQS